MTQWFFRALSLEAEPFPEKRLKGPKTMEEQLLRSHVLLVRPERSPLQSFGASFV